MTKCWECKKHSPIVFRVCYVAIRNGEPYAEKFRSLCPPCRSKQKSIGLDKVKVSKLTERTV